METIPAPHITVGVHDSSESDLAVRWGAQHAHAVGGTLHLVHAMVWAELGVSTEPVPGITDSGVGYAAQQLLADSTAIAHEIAPDLEVTSETVDGNATAVLVGASRAADVIVVGGRGLGRVMRMVMGSKSLALAARAYCPVVVVRGDIAIDGPIGLVHSENDAVIARAATLAAAYGVGVDVIVAAETPPERAEQILDHVASVVAQTSDRVDVGEVLVPKAKGPRGLVDASEGTSLIVAPAPQETGGPEHAGVSQDLAAILRFTNTPIWIER